MRSASNAVLVPLHIVNHHGFSGFRGDPGFLGGFLGSIITGHGAERMIFRETSPRKTLRRGPVSLEAQTTIDPSQSVPASAAATFLPSSTRT